jgi:hypothetical protein
VENDSKIKINSRSPDLESDHSIADAVIHDLLKEY